jgi:Tfp pilus assembly protein PilO
MFSRLKGLLEKLKWSHVVLLVGAGAAYFYFMQDNSELEQREQAIQVESQNVASSERKIQEAREFERQFEEKKKRYSELVKSLQNLKEALPRQIFLPDLLSDLYREAKQLEIEITSIRPDQKEEQGALYNSLGINLEVKGAFIQLFIFLDRMAHMSRLVNVDAFAIQLDGRKQLVTLGGEEGAFAGTKLGGGRATYPGIATTIRVLTYRYKGGAGGSPQAPEPAAGEGGVKE